MQLFDVIGDAGHAPHQRQHLLQHPGGVALSFEDLGILLAQHVEALGQAVELAQRGPAAVVRRQGHVELLLRHLRQLFQRRHLGRQRPEVAAQNVEHAFQALEVRRRRRRHLGLVELDLVADGFVNAVQRQADQIDDGRAARHDGPEDQLGRELDRRAEALVQADDFSFQLMSGSTVSRTGLRPCSPTGASSFRPSKTETALP